MNLQHLLQNHCRSGQIAETPAGHGIRLGETVNQHSTLLQTREGSDGGMLHPVRQFPVDLICQDKQILFDHDFRDNRQLFRSHDRPRRIVRERQNKDFRLRCDILKQFFLCQLKVVFFLQRNRNRDTIGQNGTRYIGDKTRLGNQHFVARIQHGTQGHVNGLTSAYRHHHFMIRIVCNMKTPF